MKGKAGKESRASGNVGQAVAEGSRTPVEASHHRRHRVPSMHDASEGLHKGL